MLIFFTDQHKQDLAVLTGVAPELWDQFLNLSLEFIRDGSNAKVFVSAAQKLEMTVESIRNGVEALSHLFIEAAKAIISEIDFLDSLLLLAFPQTLTQALWKVTLLSLPPLSLSPLSPSIFIWSFSLIYFSVSSGELQGDSWSALQTVNGSSPLPQPRVET